MNALIIIVGLVGFGFLAWALYYAFSGAPKPTPPRRPSPPGRPLKTATRAYMEAVDEAGKDLAAENHEKEAARRRAALYREQFFLIEGQQPPSE